MSRARGLTATQRASWIAYLRGSHLLERAVDQQLRVDADLTHPEYEILARLSEAPQRRLRMGALAMRSVAPKSRLTYQIDRLVARGMVRRERHLTDNRGVDAVLTDDGLALLRRVAPGHLRAVREYLVDVLTEDELRTLGELMGRVADAADAAGAGTGAGEADSG
jgi:DNA-binding MarR family transcriptional regulator